MERQAAETDIDSSRDDSTFGEWLSPAKIAEYVGCSLASAYRLARELGGGKRKHVGVRLRRSVLDQHLAGAQGGDGIPVASGAPADDDEEVLPGLTRRQLREQAGF